ncbi:CHAT domain-containing protein [Talaromyces proteolyticus]|uniref:CHAT domain-containing protein n=1 Tax=Talaromyces proteolyticus TaxID=1131652 RepID=A0AAD4KQ31_9EURO|nr:CHAT domain-containing protein [Talaromyces proteolyticus]KAH8697807.1 CHAT domain-containing protein [Talaromyces proteolyticus]
MIGDNILSHTDIITELIENVNKYHRSDDTRSTTSRDIAVCVAMQILTYAPLQRRTLTVMYHPQSPNGGWATQDGKSPDQAISEGAPHLVKLVQNNNTKRTAGTLETTDVYFQRLLVEFHFAIDSPKTEDTLQELYDLYEVLNDKAGLANCRLMQADGLLSPPFASPVTQNLIPIHTSDAAGDNSFWDPIENKILALKESDQASRCYEESLQLFRESNCHRGQAAVLLRQGSILHARACSLSPKSLDRGKYLEQATKKYDEALALFDLDEANIQTVKTNQILLDITKANVPSRDLKNRAGEIGKWGRDHKNEQLSLHLCILMLRFARREWHRYTSFDAAILGYECAHACATELGNIVAAFVSMSGRAEAYHETNYRPAAIVMVEQCINMFHPVLNYYDDLINSTNDKPLGKVDRRHIIIKKMDFVWSFATYAGRVYSRIDSLDRFNSWEDWFLSYVEKDENYKTHRREYLDYQDKPNERSVKEILGATLEEIMDEANLDRSVSRKYRIAEIMYKRLIREGNWREAEAIMHRFIEDLTTFKKIYTRDMYQMLACHLIGDTGKARETLDSMTDDEMFKNKLGELNLSEIRGHARFASFSINAIHACVIAEDWERGARILSKLLDLDPNFIHESSNTETVVYLPFRLAIAGCIYLNNSQPELAFKAFLKVRHILEMTRSQTVDIDAKVGVLAHNRTMEAYLILADICLRCLAAGLPVGILNSYEHGHPSGTAWEEHALLFMEEARARSLLDSLVTSPQKESGSNKLGQQISEMVYKRRALTHLQFLSERTEEQEKELANLAAEIENLDIGGVSSSTSDLINTVTSPIAPHSLFAHLNDDVIVIEGAFYRTGCLLLGVTNKGIESFQKGTTRLIELQRLVMNLMQTMRTMDGTHSEDEQERKSQVEALSSQISEILLAPFTEIIRRKRHVIFSVSEPLTAFPFSALMFDGRPLVMHAAVSQIPSLTVLYHLSKRPSGSSTPTVSVFTKSLSEGDVSAESRLTRQHSLPMAGIEAVNISNMFSTWPIEASTLTRGQFRDHIEEHTSVLHIGTHGVVDLENPLLSSISIGEDFRVIDMSQIQTKANLLVFAACLSGLGRAVGNDVLGFTHVVLGTGCQAYIGTLFEVSDFASMVLMTLFYRNLKSNPSLSLAEGLRNAQVEFLQFDNEKATEFIDSLLDLWNLPTEKTETDDEIKSPTDIVPEGKYLLTLQKMLLPQLDWTSPFFWAPYVLIGYGDFSFFRGPEIASLNLVDHLIGQAVDEVA